MPSNPSQPFKVAIPKREAEKIRRWYLRAKQLGIEAEFLAIVERIERNLTSRPGERGDIQYYLPELGLDMMLRLEGYLGVSYGLDSLRKIVHISNLKLLFWHPLGQDT